MTTQEIKNSVENGSLRLMQEIRGGKAFVGLDLNGEHHEASYIQREDDKYLAEAKIWEGEDDISGDMQLALGGEEMEAFALELLGLVDGTDWRKHRLAVK